MDKNAELLSELKKLNKNISQLNASRSLVRALMIGIVSGLGSVVGATIVVAAIAYLLSNIDVVPIIGSWLSEIFAHVLDNLPQQ